MQKLSILGILLLIVVYISCSGKMTAEEAFNAGQQNFNQEKFQEAMANFKEVIDNYPETEFAAKSMFMIGFINANHLKNLEEARKYYQAFVDKYPKHELVESAKYELETLGKNIEDLPIMKKIEEQEQKEKAAAN